MSDIINNSGIFDFSSVQLDFNITDDQDVIKQRKTRDKNITRLFRLYVINYRSKVKRVSKYKDALFGLCYKGTIFSFILIALIALLGILHKNNNINDVAALIVALGSIVGLFVGLLRIIVKYSFPENEDTAILNILKPIQFSDNLNNNVRIKDSKNNKNINTDKISDNL